MRTTGLFFALGFCCITLFQSCSNPIPPVPKPLDAYCIYLTGKVLKKNGTPLKNALVRFNGLPYSDSTDSAGSYLIKLRKDSASTGLTNVLSNGSYTDTLSIIKNDQTIKKTGISHWMDTLPDVIVAEIEIAGGFGSAAPPLLKTEAAVTLKIPSTAADDRTIGLSYTLSTHTFDGFVYLVFESGGPAYATCVNAYGQDSILSGRSKTIVFSSQDSAVAIPYFNPLNAVPLCDAGATQKIGVNDTFHLKGAAVDSFGVIVKWEWDIGATGTWTDVTPDSGITGVAPPKAQKAFPCILRVTNGYGATARDTVMLQVEPDTLKLTGSALKTTVSINDTIKLLATASDLFGKIVSWEWDAGNTGYFVNTTPDSGFVTIAPDTARSNYPCVLRATDNKGNVALDTVYVTVVKSPPVPRAAAAKTTVSINDTIRLLGTASDLFGHIVSWEWDDGNSGYFVNTTPDSDFITVAPDTAISKYPCILRVTDDKGTVATDTVFVSVVQDPPVPKATAAKTTVSINDTIRLLGTASDQFGHIVSWEWDAGNSGYFVNTTPDSDFITIAPDTAISKYPCILRVTDDDGNVATDTVFVNVEKVPPVPKASAVKTAVSIDDTIQLLGTASDLFGHIVSWEWDDGNSGYFVNTTPDSNFITIAPDTATSKYPCILRVTDDDGNVATDTVYINVEKSPPVPKASAIKTTVSVNDTIRLLGTASDQFGHIVSWEWDAGNTGYFVATTPDSNFVAFAPDTAVNAYPCVLSVTDNYGNTALDTVAITVIQP